MLGDPGTIDVFDLRGLPVLVPTTGNAASKVILRDVFELDEVDTRPGRGEFEVELLVPTAAEGSAEVD